MPSSGISISLLFCCPLFFQSMMWQVYCSYYPVAPCLFDFYGLTDFIFNKSQLNVLLHQIRYSTVIFKTKRTSGFTATLCRYTLHWHSHGGVKRLFSNPSAHNKIALQLISATNRMT